jgi:hypothetical protein
MRFSLIAAAVAAALVLAIPPAHAQPHQGPAIAAQRAAMERLSGMIGDWEGEASVMSPSPRTVYQREHVEADMDGLLLVIHGTGYATPERSGEPIFRAFGVISFDDQRGVYEFRVYNAGRAATAEARFLEDGRLEWVMNFAPVMIRYRIALADNTWNEVGELSRDGGATWTPTIDMRLARTN